MMVLTMDLHKFRTQNDESLCLEASKGSSWDISCVFFSILFFSIKEVYSSWKETYRAYAGNLFFIISSRIYHTVVFLAWTKEVAWQLCLILL